MFLAVAAAAMTLTACGPNQVAQNCDARTQDCYGQGVGRDSHGDALIAGAAAGALGYAAGRMSANNNRGYNGYDDHRGYNSYNHGYQRPYTRHTTVVKNYYGSAPSRSYNPVSVTRTAPSSSSFSRPSSRTMFGSARRR